MKVERERSLNDDLLRILAMLMIVCFHYCIHGNGEQIFSTSFSIQQVISYTFGSVSYTHLDVYKRQVFRLFY